MAVSNADTPNLEPVQVSRKATPRKFKAEARRDKLLKLILGGTSNLTEISKKLHVNRKTVYRDLARFLESEHALWANVEWISQYERIKKTNPEKAFEGLTRIVVRTMREKTSVEGTLKVESLKIGFEADPDLKKALMEEADRQRREDEQPAAV